MKKLISSQIIINEFGESIVAVDGNYNLCGTMVDPDILIGNYLHSAELRRVSHMRLSPSSGYHALCCGDLALRIILPASIKTHLDLLHHFLLLNLATIQFFEKSHEG